jgi:hypothetical protein
MFCCSIDKSLWDYTVSHPRGQSSLYPLPWEPQISQSPISAVNWTVGDSSESCLWIVLLCEAIQVNNPTTVVITRQQMCSVFLRALYTELVLDSELQKADTVIQFFFFFFGGGESVHHRTIQINYQPDATIFQFIILTFIYSWICFGHSPAHHQGLNDCWFTGPTTNTARLSPRYEGKTRGCHCSHWAPDDGRENARNMLSCKQTSG